MAYLTDHKPDKCHESGCTARATVTVFDRWNGYRGDFCRKHGTAEVKRLDAAGA